MRSVLLRATMGSSSPWTISAGARSRSAAGSLAARTLSSGLMSAPGGNTPAAVSDGEAAPESPRAVARRVAEQVSGLGYTLICGPELEFYVCQQAADGSWLWPGYSENSRVLEWIFRRLEGTAEAVDTQIGRLPAPGAINIAGLSIGAPELAELLRVDAAGWANELPELREHLAKFGEKLPPELSAQLEALTERLGA